MSTQKTDEKIQGITEDTNKEDELYFEEAISEYITHIKSSIEILPLVAELLSAKITQESDHIDTFMRENNIQEVEEDDKKRLLIPTENFSTFVSLNRKLEVTALAMNFIPVNFFVSFVSQYDAYLSDLIKIVFKVKPEILNASEKSMTFSELMSFESFEEAKDYVIEKEINTVMRESHIEQFKWLEKKLKIELRKDLPSFKEFIEITERRNLFVHTNGIVSRQYIQVCKENNVENIDKLKIGNKLRINAEYLVRAYSVMFEIGVKLGQVLWRKLQPNSLKHADISLNNLCYNLMIEKRYKLSINLLSFATDTLKNHYDQDIVYTLIINKALAYYLNNQKEDSKKTLDKTDWSATNDKFKLALAVLLENYDKAADIMLSIGSSNQEVTKRYYAEWPLFVDFRKTELFQGVYRQVFKEEFIYVEDKPRKLADIVHKHQDQPLSEDQKATIEDGNNM